MIMITLLKSQGYLAKHRCSSLIIIVETKRDNPKSMKSNVGFSLEGKTRVPGKNLKEEIREPANHIVLCLRTDPDWWKVAALTNVSTLILKRPQALPR